jgi:hypothetical protein
VDRVLLALVLEATCGNQQEAARRLRADLPGTVVAFSRIQRALSAQGRDEGSGRQRVGTSP